MGGGNSGRGGSGLRPQQPGLPAGVMSNRELGQILKWGLSSAEARAQIPHLSGHELLRQGITSEDAIAWRDFYARMAHWDSGNPSASGRVDLLSAVVELLR